MRCIVAVRAFFRVLFDRDFAGRVDAIFADPLPAQSTRAEAAPAPEKPKPKKPAARSEAISLLAALQREGRLVDFLQESLESYSDDQIGAAARDVHRDCGAVLRRMFDLRPVLSEQEGATVEVPSGYDTGCYRLTGNVTGEPPFRGSMVHHGWKAAVCQVPEWSGGKESLFVVVPAEVELK